MLNFCCWAYILSPVERILYVLTIIGGGGASASAPDHILKKYMQNCSLQL